MTSKVFFTLLTHLLLVAEFANLPLIRPYLENGKQKNWGNGVNFASGGSGDMVETNDGMVIDLKTQLGYFKNIDNKLRSQLGNKEAELLLSKSVYLFSVGDHDILVPSPIFSSYSPGDYVTTVIGNFTQVIKESHKKGARKFGFFGIIPLGFLPCTRAKKGVNGQCVEQLTSLTKLYNASLS